MYERVKDDEKLMMGFKLTYSLLHPTEARAIREVNKIQNEETQPKAIQVQQPVVKVIEAPPALVQVLKE